MKNIEVVAAIIYDSDGRIFATQRGSGDWKDWWEFPGGKIENGETPEDALKLASEELNIPVEDLIFLIFRVAFSVIDDVGEVNLRGFAFATQKTEFL